MTSSARKTTAILVGLPVLSNVVSFFVFAPLFVPGQSPTTADFQRASFSLGIAFLIIEILALLLVTGFLRKERLSLQSVIHLQRDKLQTYFTTGLIALFPTLVAGWLYSKAQAQVGIQTNLSQLGSSEIALWYLLTPIVAAFVEEIIWRGYAVPRIQGRWRSVLVTSLSFAFFHGIFNPLALVATFIQGLTWSWAYQRTESTIPSMLLHFLSRYLVLIPGFG